MRKYRITTSESLLKYNVSATNFKHLLEILNEMFDDINVIEMIEGV